MEVSPLPAAGAPDREIAGWTESVKDGVAQVRLPGGALVEASCPADLEAGSPVALSPGPDGHLKARAMEPSPGTGFLQEALLQALSDLLEEPEAAPALARALAEGKFAQASPLLERTPAGEPRILLGPPESAPPPSGAAVVDLLAQPAPGTYQARVAGRSRDLLASPDLPLPQRIIAQSRALPGGWSLWTPGPILAAGQDQSPEPVATDRAGARRLLLSVGLAEAPEPIEQELSEHLKQVAARLSRQEPLPPPRAETIEPAPPAGPGGDPVDPVHLGLGPTRPAAAGAPLAAGIEEDQPAPPPQKAQAAPAAVTRPGADPASPPLPVAKLDHETARRALAIWIAGIDPTDGELEGLLGRGRPLGKSLEALAAVLERGGRGDSRLAREVARLLEQGRISPDDRRGLESILGSDPEPPGSQEEAQLRAEVATRLLGQKLSEQLVPQGPVSGWVRSPQGWEEAKVEVHDRRTRRGHAEASTTHVAEVSMRPPGLGRVDARLELSGRNLSISIRCETAATSERIAKSLPELRQALEASGMVVQRLESTRAKTEPHPSRAQGRKAGGSLDVSA